MGTVKNEREAKNSKGQYFRGDQGSGMDRALIKYVTRSEPGRKVKERKTVIKFESLGGVQKQSGIGLLVL